VRRTRPAIALWLLLVVVGSSACEKRANIPDAPRYVLAFGGGFGSGAGQFRSPNGIAVDPEGNVYVVDAGNLEIAVDGNENV
jgi:sugar lactone lactonase YvrE